MTQKLKAPFFASLILCLGLIAGLFAAPAAQAASLAGVEAPETHELNGQKLVLNGLGLRKKFFFKVYVGGLYLAQKSSDANAILNSPTPKYLKLHFLRDVGADKMVEAWTEGYSANCLARCKETAPQLKELNSWMEDLKEGQTLEFLFEGEKFSVVVNGTPKGSISEEGFSKNILSIFLGKEPADSDLKKGILGKS